MTERKSYWEKLRDPRWQKKRLEVMQSRNFTCEACSATDKTLNVHHKLYRKGADPWDYADAEYECLCEACHEQAHHWKSLINEALAKSRDHEVILGFIEGRNAIDAAVWAGGEKGAASIRSYSHAWGFRAAMMARTPAPEVEQLMEMVAITPSEVFELNVHNSLPTEVAAKRKA